VIKKLGGFFETLAQATISTKINFNVIWISLQKQKSKDKRRFQNMLLSDSRFEIISFLLRIFVFCENYEIALWFLFGFAFSSSFASSMSLFDSSRNKTQIAINFCHTLLKL